MLVNRLTLVVVFERLQSIGSGDGLRGLVGFEASVQDPLAGRERCVAHALVAEHQVVVGLEVLRVDFERLLEARNRLVEAALEETDAADLVEHHAVTRVLIGDEAEALDRLVVPAERLHGGPEEVMRLGQTRRELQRGLEHRDRRGHLALLKPGARDVHRAVGVTRIHRDDVHERGLGSLEIALEEQADPVVVPALPHRGIHERLDGRPRGPAVGDVEHRLALGHDRDRDVRDRLDLPGHCRRVARERPGAVVVRVVDSRVRPGRRPDASERPLRVPPCELAIVDLRAEEDSVAGVLRDLQPVVNGVGGPVLDQPHVGHGPRHPGVPLVDRVAVGVELEAPVEVRARIHGSLSLVFDRAAVHEHAPPVVDRFELDPDIERIDGSPGKEMTDFPGPHDDLDADGLAATDGHRDPVERREHLGRRHRRRHEGRARRARLLADRERARDPGSGGRPGHGQGTLGHGLGGMRDAEHVDRDLAIAQEVLHDLQLHRVMVDEKHGGICGREPV